MREKTYLLNTNQLQQYVSLFLGIGVRLEPTEGMRFKIRHL
jgi:hypothetical protein